MDKCKYKNLLRDSAKLLNNSQYTNQNTAYLPLDVYTCYDNFLPPDFYVSGASKMSQFYYYSPTGYHYSLINMKPTGPTGATTNSVWNNSFSATTLEYYLPDYSRMSGYTGKFRSSIYKWDNNQGGFVYPPVHTKIFHSFPQTVKTATIVQTTATTFSVFFEIDGTTTAGATTVSAPRFYWWGKSPARTTSNPGKGSISSIGTISAAIGARAAGTYTLGVADYTTSLTGVNAKFTVVVDSVGGANGGILTTANVGVAVAARAAGTYTIGASDYTTELAGNTSTFSIVADGTGAATVTITAPGKDFVLNETITVPDANLGSGGAAALTFEAATIAGITITDGGSGFVVTEVVNVPDANLGGGGAANLTFQAATVHGCCLGPTEIAGGAFDDFSTGSSLTKSFASSVFITTAGTFGNTLSTADTTTTTHRSKTISSNLNYVSAYKNGHIIPTPNPITGYINGQTGPGNLGVTGNGGYWENGNCYMTGSSWDLTIGAGNGVLSGMPKYVYASSVGPSQGLYTGFATGNVYVYTAKCETKLVDTIPVSQTASNAGLGSAANSNTYLSKGSFIYSGNGTTDSCYLSSGVIHDTLVDDPNNPNYLGINNSTYLNNLYYPPSDNTFIVVTNPPIPKLIQPNTTKLINSDEVGDTTTTNELELVVENLPITSTGEARYYLSQEPVGDVSLSINGLVLQKDIEYTQDKREINIIVDETVAGTVNIKLTDKIVVSYVKGTGIVGLISESAKVPTSVTHGNSLNNTNYSTFNYNIQKESYEYYTEQPIDRAKAKNLANLIVLRNGVKLTPNDDYYRSTTIDKLIIFNPKIVLVSTDTISIYYVTNLLGQDSTSLGSPTKDIVWTLATPPLTDNGYFEVQVTSSGDTGFTTQSVYSTKNYVPNISNYQATIGPFTKANQRYLYRVVNHRTFVAGSASTLTTSATSITYKFDTLSAAFKSY